MKALIENHSAIIQRSRTETGAIRLAEQTLYTLLFAGVLIMAILAAA